MPMFFKEVKVTERHCAGFVCNRCKVQHDEDDFVEMQEMLHWRNTGGFGSVWGDGATVEVTLCQKCTLELFEDFATIHKS